MFTGEIEEILEEIEQSLGAVTDAERAYWKLSPDERARLPQPVRACFGSLSG